MAKTIQEEVADRLVSLGKPLEAVRNLKLGDNLDYVLHLDNGEGLTLARITVMINIYEKPIKVNKEVL